MKRSYSRKQRVRRTTTTELHPTAVISSTVIQPLDDAIIFEVPSTEISCFICNTSYWTTVSQTVVTQVSTNRILTFCNLFAVNDAEKQNMLRLACLNEPFCAPCSQKMSQLQDWIAQLELIQKGIESLKTDISVLMVDSLIHSPDIEGTHFIKEKLVRAWNASLSSKDKTPVTFHDLVHVETFPEPEPNDLPKVQETGAIGQPEIVVEDGFFNPDSEGHAEFEDNFSSIGQEDLKGSTSKKPKRGRREPSVRQRRSEIIPAHPDGHCRLCPSTFKSQMQLSKHIRRAHSGISHPCRYCDRTFQDTSNRKRHEVSVHITKTRDYICDQCGKSYKTPWMLRAHTQQSHEGVIFKQHRKIPSQCHVCGRVCTNLKNLRTHVRANHTERNIKCSICERPFKDYQRQRRHELTHLSPWELKERIGKTYHYKCSICPLEGQIGWKAKTSLQEHYVNEHPEHQNETRNIPTKPLKSNRKYFCKECPTLKGFTRRTALDYHLKHGHAESRGLLNKFGRECQICYKPCRDTTKAVLHQSTHFPKAYVCHLCIFTATQNRDIVSHYSKVHPLDKMPKFRSFLNPQVKRFFCPQCPNHAGFANKKKMRLHIKARHSRFKNIKVDYESSEDEENIKTKLEDSQEDEELPLIKIFGKTCQICQKPCRDSTKAILHQATHFPSAHVCHLCIYVATKTCDMVNHYNKVHPNDKMPKFPPFNRQKVKRFLCPLCPDHPGFAEKDKMRKHIMVQHTKKFKNTIENYKDERGSESELHESDEEAYVKKINRKKVTYPQFSRRGRSLKPSRKLQTQVDWLESEKKLIVKVERVDEKWPKGKVRRVKPIEVKDHLEEEEIKIEVLEEEEDSFFEPFLVTFADTESESNGEHSMTLEILEEKNVVD